MLTDPPELAPIDDEEPRGDISTLPLIFGTVAVLCLAVILTIAALVATNDDETGAGTDEPVHVVLSEFAISPAAISVPSGGALHVSNEGAVVHNVSIVDTDLVTPDLAAGETAELDVSSLEPGSYEVLCLIAGHADSGMKADLEVVAGAGGSAAAPMDHSASGGDAATMDYEKMTADMLADMAEFPAETAGVGNELLAPTEVTADGTKVFDLTMEIADWEVSAGNVVQAWTFNGIVPGPMLDLEVGDSVQVRVQNDLPIATDVHWHGINVDNANDGVAPLTQELIEPGDTFTYSFTTDEPSVAMYHPHAHGHELLPDGMFGVLLVGDTRLPVGQTVGYEQVPADVEVSQEIPIVLNDAGVIGFSLNGKSFPATAPISAKVGDWILVHYYNEGTQIHPMHLHQFDQIVVAKDGYPLDAPYTADTVNVAPGERYSVLVQIDRPGAWVWHCHILPHVETADGMFGMLTALIAE